MPEQDNWKEELLNEADARIMEVVYEWANINFGVEMWVQDSTQIREIIEDTLSSQANALKEQMKACVPKVENRKGIFIPSEMSKEDCVDKGFNICREQTLSAIESIEI